MPRVNLITGLIIVSLLSAIPWISWLASVMFFTGLVLPSFGFLVSSTRRGTQL